MIFQFISNFIDNRAVFGDLESELSLFGFIFKLVASFLNLEIEKTILSYHLILEFYYLQNPLSYTKANIRLDLEN